MNDFNNNNLDKNGVQKSYSLMNEGQGKIKLESPKNFKVNQLQKGGTSVIGKVF